MAKSLLIMRLGSFAVMTVFALLFTTANASEMPKSWPWIGVTTDNLNFTPEELTALKKQLPRMNSIRLTLLARQTAERKHLTPAETWKDMAAWTNKMLDVCAKNNIVAIVSINQFPVDPATYINQDSPDFWSNATERRSVITYVEQMAKDFTSRGDELGAFEVMSEPFVAVNKQPLQPKEWPSLMLEIVSSIRKYSNKWIVVTPGPGGFARGYTKFVALNDRHIVYGAHMYEPNTFALQGVGESWPTGSSYPGRIGFTYWDKNALVKIFQPLKNFQNKYQVPVWIGEFSAARWAKGSNQYLLDVIDLSNSYGWGWAYFNMGGYHGWDPDYDSNYPTTDTPPKKIGHSSERWQMLNSTLGAH
jgi:hypothetical protein